MARAGPDTDDYIATLDLPVKPETVLALFTSPEGISRWWGPATGDGTAGGTLIVSFGDYGCNVVRVEEVSRSRVAWAPVVADGAEATGHLEEWLGTRIEFDVEPAAGGSRLHFRHAGLTPQLACWNDCEAAWDQFLDSIRAYAETGTGRPFGA